MQKWEYLYIEINLSNVVEKINGQWVAEGNVFTGIKGKKTWEFLNILGQEGWEAVGIDIINVQAASYGRSLLLKRSSP